MNDKNKDLMVRALTALVFVPTVLAALFGGPYLYSILFLIVLVVSSAEYYNLIFSNDYDSHFFRRNYGIFLSCFVYFTVAINNLFPDYINFNEPDLQIALLPLAFIAFIYELYKQAEKPFHNIALVISGIIYIGVPMVLLQYLAFGVGDDGFDSRIVIGLIVMNWLNDSGAYMVGSRIGKTPLFPRISPKKTWEGTMGGIVACIICGFLFAQFWDVLDLVDWIALAVITAIFGSLGDLVESMLKRSVKVKDSGKFLPGHGGMLDRFDAFIFLLPFASAYIYFAR
jgi:phosphatidate cytidylyltransferase